VTNALDRRVYCVVLIIIILPTVSQPFLSFVNLVLSEFTRSGFDISWSCWPGGFFRLMISRSQVSIAFNAVSIAQ
jgi:hypothetical protein